MSTHPVDKNRSMVPLSIQNSHTTHTFKIQRNYMGQAERDSWRPTRQPWDLVSCMPQPHGCCPHTTYCSVEVVWLSLVCSSLRYHEHRYNRSQDRLGGGGLSPHPPRALGVSGIRDRIGLRGDAAYLYRYSSLPNNLPIVNN